MPGRRARRSSQVLGSRVLGAAPRDRACEHAATGARGCAYVWRRAMSQAVYPRVSSMDTPPPRTENKPSTILTDAINGRIEHLHASALGFSISHPLHHSSTSLNRRIQTLPIPQIMKSQRSCRVPNPYGYHQRKIQLHRRRLRKGNAPHETTCSLSPGCAQTSGGYRSVTLCSPKSPGLQWSAGTRPGDQTS